VVRESVVQQHTITLLKWLKPDCIFLSIPNEGKRSKVAGGIMRSMGLTRGAADIVFLWANGCACVEMKSETGKQSIYQKIFQGDCLLNGIPYAVCRSADEVVIFLEGLCRLPRGTSLRIRGFNPEIKK
jgi:hypothetical protein